MFEIKGKDIYLTRGDTFRAQVGLQYKDGGEYTPVTGDRIRFALKRRYNDNFPVFIKEIAIGDLILQIDPEDTKRLNFGEYVYDIEITFANGDVDTFIGKDPTSPARFFLVEEVD